MVVLQIKSTDKDTFLYETTCDTSNDVLIRELVAVWNMRIRLGQLAGAIRDLARHGPMKPPDKQGIDHIEEQFNKIKIDKNEHYCEDPQGVRNGNGVGPQVTEVIEKVAVDAEAAIDKATVDRKFAITLPFLQEKLDNVRGAVTIAYPMGLPAWDTVKMTIDGSEGLEGTSAGQALLDADSAELWVASRNFERSKTVADRLGRNEKTKCVAKLQKPGDGAPGREPVINEEEKKAMMAYYFKKQEEMKKLAENGEDEYLHSAWADPKAMQKGLRGMGDVRAPGMRK